MVDIEIGEATVFEREKLNNFGAKVAAFSAFSSMALGGCAGPKDEFAFAGVPEKTAHALLADNHNVQLASDETAGSNYFDQLNIEPYYTAGITRYKPYESLDLGVSNAERKRIENAIAVVMYNDPRLKPDFSRPQEEMRNKVNAATESVVREFGYGNLWDSHENFKSWMREVGKDEWFVQHQNYTSKSEGGLGKLNGSESEITWANNLTGQCTDISRIRRDWARADGQEAYIRQINSTSIRPDWINPGSDHAVIVYIFETKEGKIPAYSNVAMDLPKNADGIIGGHGKRYRWLRMAYDVAEIELQSASQICQIMSDMRGPVLRNGDPQDQWINDNRINKPKDNIPAVERFRSEMDIKRSLQPLARALEAEVLR